MVIALGVLWPLLVGQVYERIPTYGMTDPSGLTFLWDISSVSESRREILRNAGNPEPPAPTLLEPRGMPVAIDLVNGVIERLDLTSDGLEPRKGSLPASSWIHEVSRDHRFVLIRSDATNLKAIGGATGWYVVDRNADGDGAFDELADRRILALPWGAQDNVGSGLGGHSGKTISDDARYIVSWRTIPHTSGNPGGEIIMLTDLDADRDGVLGSPLPGSITITPVNQLPAAAALPFHSSRPSISADGRIISWEEWQTYDVVGINPLGGYEWAYPDGWPYSRRILALDRDSDGDGALDEPGDWNETDLTLGAPLFWNSGPSSGVTASGRFVLFISRSNESSTTSESPSALIAVDLRNQRKEQWLPFAGGPPIDSNGPSNFPVVIVHRGDRQVSFTADLSERTQDSKFVAARLDRDPDGDGRVDVGEPTVLLFDSRDVLSSRVVGGSDEGSILVSKIGFPDDAFTYEYQVPGLLFADCRGQVRLEYPIALGCPAPLSPAPSISIAGCPYPGETVTVREEVLYSTGGHLFLLASAGANFTNWSHACGAYALDGAATALCLPPAPLPPTATSPHTSVMAALALPLHLHDYSLSLQGAVVDPKTSEITFGGRVVVKVP